LDGHAGRCRVPSNHECRVAFVSRELRRKVVRIYDLSLCRCEIIDAKKRYANPEYQRCRRYKNRWTQS
jgi:hypothetical protein